MTLLYSYSLDIDVLSHATSRSCEVILEMMSTRFSICSKPTYQELKRQPGVVWLISSHCSACVVEKSLPQALCQLHACNV